MALSSDTWFPVITLILGAALKGLFDALSEKRAEMRDRRSRSDSRRDSIQQKRIEFQQSTLLEFQDVVSRLARLIGRAHHEDEMSFRTSGEWRGDRISEEVDKGIAAQQTEFSKLKVRIRDDSTRDLAAQFSDTAIACLMSQSQDEARASMMKMTDNLIALNERVGTLLRELDIEESGVMT